LALDLSGQSADRPRRLYLTWRYAGETACAPQRELDLPGQIAAVTTLGSLAGAIIEAGALGWDNVFVVGVFAAALVSGVMFLVRERRAQQPMLPLSLFQHRMFSLTTLVGLLVNIAFYGLIFVLSLYFQKINGLSPFATGLAFVPMLAAVLPVNLLAARIAEHLGAPATISAGAALSAAGCLAMLGIKPGTSYSELCVQMIAIGVGLGLLVPPLTSALLGSVEKSRSGIAAGVLNATRQTGSVLGVALFGSLVANADSFMAGAQGALVISASVLLRAAGAILWGTAARQ
jgi:MFS transporter, DHA2 family, methylenomycin A resistance protein